MASFPSAETLGLHMHPQDSLRSRVRVLKRCEEAELRRALELACACKLSFPGYGHRRTVALLRRVLEAKGKRKR